MCRLCAKLLPSCVWFFVTLRSVAHQAPLFMRFSRQAYWSGWSCHPQGTFPTWGGTRVSSISCLVGGFLAAHTTCYASLSQRGYTVRSYMLLDRQQHLVSSLTENLYLTLMPRWREKVVSWGCRGREPVWGAISLFTMWSPKFCKAWSEGAGIIPSVYLELLVRLDGSGKWPY